MTFLTERMIPFASSSVIFGFVVHGFRTARSCFACAGLSAVAGSRLISPMARSCWRICILYLFCAMNFWNCGGIPPPPPGGPPPGACASAGTVASERTRPIHNRSTFCMFPSCMGQALCLPLLVSQCVYGVKPGRFAGRIDSEQHTDDGREPE